MGRQVGLALAIMTFTMGQPAVADTVQDRYVRYHSAIRAAEHCTDYRFEQQGDDDPDAAWILQAQSSIGAYLEQEVSFELGVADRLDMIAKAQSDTDELIAANGCNDPEAIDLLAVFESELAPLLPSR